MMDQGEGSSIENRQLVEGKRSAFIGWSRESVDTCRLGIVINKHSET